MARNALDSVVKVTNRQIVKLEGKLVSQDEHSVTFSYRPPRLQRWNQEIFPRTDVVEVSETKLLVFRDVMLDKIVGSVTADKFGFLTVDGVSFNPRYTSAVADLGTPGASEGKKKVSNLPLKKKKAA